MGVSFGGVMDSFGTFCLFVGRYLRTGCYFFMGDFEINGYLFLGLAFCK